MTGQEVFERVEDCMKEAALCARRRETNAVGYHLTRAAQIASDIQEDADRRNWLSAIAKEAINSRNPTLAQQIAGELIPLDRKLQNPGFLITDLLSFGSSFLLSQQFVEAEETNRQALDLSLELQYWQKAAAASSNLASAMAAQGHLQEARTQLEQSLLYLGKEPDTDTEIRTKAMIIGVMNGRSEPPEKCFEFARQLIIDHGAVMGRSGAAVIGNTLHPILERFFEANPEIDSAAWVQQNFPELMEDADD